MTFHTRWSDKTGDGKELRLVQQYFFVACSLRDIFRRLRKDNEDLRDFPEKVAIQLNDTHPAVAIMLRDSLVHHDPFLCLPDFESYSECHKKVDAAFRDPVRWARMAILNTARMGKFSSDRTISEYARDIWKLDPVRV